MARQTIKKRSWLKIILISVLVIAVILAGVYWYVATEKFSDTKTRKAAYTVDALTFIREFEKDSSAANKKYRDQIIIVNGRVSQLESPDTSTVNVKFIDPGTGDYAIFAFQDIHLAEAKSIKEGDSIAIKGSCGGVAYSEILDLRYIPFQRSTLNK
jgi:nitrogen fixation-related uncharacterized protein